MFGVRWIAAKDGLRQLAVLFFVVNLVGVLGQVILQPMVLARIHAGSVVLPLHNPIRVLADWSMLDGLSGGRVGMSVAAGWHPLDFLIAPGTYADRRQVAATMLKDLRAAWRDGLVRGTDPEGVEQQVRVRPDRVQPQLPIWLTTSGRP